MTHAPNSFQVCLEKMQDLQLALVISRLYEFEFETASTYKKILQRHVLGQDKQVQFISEPWFLFFHWNCSMFWISYNFDNWQAVETKTVNLRLCGFQIQAHPDPFLRSIAHWVLEDYSGALDTLLEQPVKNTRSVSTEGECDAGKSEVLLWHLLIFKNKTLMIFVLMFGRNNYHEYRLLAQCCNLYR